MGAEDDPNILAPVRRQFRTEYPHSPSATRSNFAKRPTERNWPDRPDFSVRSTGLSPTYPPCSEQNGASTTGRRVWQHITTTPVGGGLPAPLSAVNFLGSRVLHLMVVCRRGHDVVAEPRLRAPEGKCGSDARPGLPRPHKLLGRFSTDDEVERWVRDMFEQSRLGGKSATLRGAYALTSLRWAP